MRAWPLPVLFVLLGGACVTTRAAAVDQSLEPDWIEVRTPHLQLWVELDAAGALQLARGMEAVRSAIAAFWGPQFDPADVLEVIVFADRRSLAQFVPSGVGGYVVEGPFGPLMVMSANGAGGRAVASHELAHHLAASTLLRVPHWLGEGLATYLETVEIDPTGQRVTFGKPPSSISPADLAATPLTLAQLWAWGTIDLTPRDSSQYSANAWWLVHHLLDFRPEQFEAFERLLTAGDDPKAAWERAFAGLTDAELEAELSAALALHQLKNFAKPLRLKAIEPTTAPVSYADVYALRAELLSRTTVPLQKDEWQRQIEDQLESALVLDDKNELALLLKSSLIREERTRAEFLRAVVAKLPRSGRALSDLGASLGRMGKDSRPMLEQAVQLEPDNPRLINNAAWSALLFGQSERGLELAQRAVALRPYSSSLVDTLAVALASAGRCSEAVDRAHQAIDLLGHWARSRSSMLARLRRYEHDCSPQRPVQPTRE